MKSPGLSPFEVPNGRRALDHVVLRIGLQLAILMVAVQTTVHVVNYAVGGPQFFSVDGEYNPIAWVHASLIVIVGFSAMILALADSTQRRPAFALSAILAFFSLDEAVLIHERIAQGVLDSLGMSPRLGSLVWPILYAPLGIATALLVWRLAKSSPEDVKRYLVVGIGWLVLSVVAEIIGILIPQEEFLGYVVRGGIEEGAELIGWTMLAAGLTARAILSVQVAGSEHVEHRSLT